MNTQQKISWLKNHHKPNWIDKLIYTGTRKNAAQTGKIRTQSKRTFEKSSNDSKAIEMFQTPKIKEASKLKRNSK